MPCRGWSLTVWRLLVLAGTVAAFASAVADDNAKLTRIDPAVWGDDHIGKPFPATGTMNNLLSGTETFVRTVH